MTPKSHPIIFLPLYVAAMVVLFAWPVEAKRPVPSPTPAPAAAIGSCTTSPTTTGPTEAFDLLAVLPAYPAVASIIYADGTTYPVTVYGPDEVVYPYVFAYRSGTQRITVGGGYCWHYVWSPTP